MPNRWSACSLALMLFMGALVMGALVGSASAQWIPAGRSYTKGSAQPDGQGNLINKNGPSKIDSTGTLVWSLGLSPIPIAMASDRAGGVIIATMAGHITLARVNSNGTLAWSGVALNPDVISVLALATDAAGNSFVVWKQGTNQIMAAKVSSSGLSQWTSNGLLVCTLVNALGLTYLKVLPDESGGCYVAWEDFRNATASGPTDVYMQHISSAGAALWTANGIQIAGGATTWQQHIAMCSDGSGGVIIAWDDSRNGDRDLYAQRVDGSGTSLWNAGGTRIFADAVGNAQDQTDPAIVPDGSGGAFLAWTDWRNTGAGHASDIYAQQINSSGAVQWGADGVPVAATSNTESAPRIASDGAGGVLVGWTSPGTAVQHLISSGVPIWAINGLQPMVPGGGIEDLVPDGTGSFYVGGVAVTAPGENRVVRVYPNGNPSWVPNYLARSIVASDIPGDEGGWVSVGFNRSLAEAAAGAWASPAVAGYSLWKKRPGSSAIGPSRLVDSKAILAGLSSIPSVGGPWTGYTDFPAGTWDLVSYQPALQIPAYSILAPTSADSTQSAAAENDFVLMTHTSAQNTFVVAPSATGHSIDNLPPGVPQNLTGGKSGNGVLLHWSAAAENDLWHYSVYRGTSPSFVPSPANRIGQPTVATFQDDGFVPDVSYYKVSAVDRHENESIFALLSPSQILSVPPGVAPTRTYLAPAIPNPFQGMTAFEYGVAHRSAVSITIYDSRGRRVRRLVEGPRDPGTYREIWDGADDSRRSTSAGVYFVRFEADGRRQTLKLARVE